MNSVAAAIGFAVILVVIFVLFGPVLWAAARRRAKEIEEEMDADCFTVRPSNLSFVFGIMFMAVSVGCVSSIYTKGVTDRVEIIYSIVFAVLLSLPGLYFLMFRLHCKVTVKGKRITYMSFWGKEESCAFDDITIVERGLVAMPKGGNVDTIKAYRDMKLIFRVNAYWPGFDLLASRLESEGVSIFGFDD